ncbi:MAG: FGGY-family carbohydrate kinase [Actinobacteria bacterium]|nr:FGGY-family carbohydrate kinase [Actinomycetota bacterium]
MPTTPKEGLDAHDAYALAIDLGTGGPKVGIVSYAGDLVRHEFSPVETRHLDGGGAVQDADDWWRAITTMITELVASGTVPTSAITAVSITGQYASTVPVDATGAPVGDAVLWMDTRGGPYARKRFGGHAAGYDARTIATWIRRTGGAPALSGADPIGQRLALQAREPAVTKAARWMLEPIDQLTMRFTGVASASPASMAVAWLIDTRQPGTFTFDPDLVRRSGVDPRQLPPLGPTNRFIGTILPSVARTLGLAEGTSVVAALPDLHTGALGSGAVRQHQGHLALSTSSWISAPVEAKKTDIVRQIATVPGLTPTGRLVIDNHEVGGLALSWFRDKIWNTGDTTPPYDEITRAAAGVEPGSGSVIFTPWLNGERSPVEDSRARGGFHNLSLATGRAELARAVLEGVAYNSRWLLDAVEKFTSCGLDPIRIIGGGAVSDLWCQIHADVLDRRIERPRDPMFANLRGAGLAAGIASGTISVDDVADLVPVERTFVPDAANRSTYDRIYGEFTKRYRADKAMFHRLNSR